MSKETTGTEKPGREGNDGFWRSEAITVVGTGVSILVGVLVWTSGVATGTESFIIGIVLTVVTLQLQQIRDSRVRSELETAIRKSPWRRSRVVALLSRSSEVVRAFGDEVVDELDEVLVDTERHIQDLGRGTIVSPGDDYTDLISRTVKVKRSLFGLTNIASHPTADSESWWTSSVGRAYWQANLNALARGVRITRVFICSTISPALQEILTEQAAAGVDVRTVDSSLVVASKQLNLAIWDSRTAWEGQVNPRGVIIRNIVSVDKEEVRRLQQVADSCFSHSTAFIPKAS